VDTMDKHFLLKNSAEILEQTAQGGGGLTNAGGVHEMFRCCSEGHGLVRAIGSRWTVGLDLFQPWRFYDSMKLFYLDTWHALEK